MLITAYGMTAKIAICRFTFLFTMTMHALLYEPTNRTVLSQKRMTTLSVATK